MTCFVDTSALYAVLDADDANHGSAKKQQWAAFLRDGAILFTSNYVLVDCVSFALLRKLGVREVFAFDAHFADQGFRCLPAG